MQHRTLGFARSVWLILCVSGGTLGGALFGFTVGGVLAAIACAIAGAAIGLFIGSSFLTLLELMFT